MSESLKSDLRKVQVLALEVAVEALQKECEALRKDAERYRWLRASPDAKGDELRVGLMRDYGDSFLDQEIDAAIAKEQP